MNPIIVLYICGAVSKLILIQFRLRAIFIFIFVFNSNLVQINKSFVNLYYDHTNNVGVGRKIYKLFNQMT